MPKCLYYKSCFVEECANTTVSTPNKLFVTVPKNPYPRKLWFDAVKRDLKAAYSTTTFYCCQDHFDLPNDVENWMEHTLMKRRIRLKKSVVPHIFDRKRTANTTDLSVQTPVFTEHERLNQKGTGFVSILRKSALKRQKDEITNEIVPSSSSIIACDVKNDVPHICECKCDRKREDPVPVHRKDALKHQEIEITDNILPGSSSCIVSGEDNNLYLVVFTPIELSMNNQECKKMKIEEASTSNCGIEFVDVNNVDNTSEHLNNSAPIDDKLNVLIESENIKTEYDPDNIQGHTYVTDECGQQFIIKTEIDIKEEMLDC